MNSEDDAVKGVSQFEVASWSLGKKGAGAVPTQVHIILDLPDQIQVIRLKSRAVTDSLIAALIEHRDYVWPEKEAQS